MSAAWCDEIKSLGARIVAWNSQVDPASVQAAHDRGLKVWVYTVNDPDAAKELLDAGVDGVITDQPVLLRQVLAGRSAGK